MAAASAGVSRGSKLIVTTSKSFPGSSVITSSEAASAFNTCVQSIGTLVVDEDEDDRTRAEIPAERRDATLFVGEGNVERDGTVDVLIESDLP